MATWWAAMKACWAARWVKAHGLGSSATGGADRWLGGGGLGDPVGDLGDAFVLLLERGRDAVEHNEQVQHLGVGHGASLARALASITSGSPLDGDLGVDGIRYSGGHVFGPFGGIM